MASVPFRSRPSLRLAVVFATVLLAFVASVVLQGGETALLEESGGVEILTLLTLAGTAVWSYWPGAGRPVIWPVSAVIALLALRELDVQDWFFEPGLLQSRIFSAPVPVWQKAVSGAAMLGVLATLIALAVRGTGPALRALRAGRDWTLWLASGGLLVAGAMLFDGFGRRLAGYGIDLGAGALLVVASLEETSELVFSLCILVAVVLWRETAPPRG